MAGSRASLFQRKSLSDGLSGYVIMKMMLVMTAAIRSSNICLREDVFGVGARNSDHHWSGISIWMKI